MRRRQPYMRKQVVHDIGQEPDTKKYLNALTKVKVHEGNGSIHLLTGIHVRGKTVTHSRVIGKVDLNETQG